ncbi:MAG: class I SAM-dependent methyltransferase [Acidobacteria bacterium]|nr:class I SAM-dependent methyltransferase [Acidobacteriota bacterium]
MRLARISCSLIVLLLLVAATACAQKPTPTRSPDVVFVPTPPEVIEAMLKLAEVTKNDVVYDLGCGDGRIVTAAAKDFGARAIGIDIDPQRVSEARERIAQAGVGNRATIRHEDLFEADIKEATVVTLYLLTSLNEKLKPKLLRDLKPGTRIVSQTFDMGDWKPEKEIEVDGRNVYFWRIPANKPVAKK